MDEDMVLVEVHCVRFDVFNKIPVVLLKDQVSKKFLPIWIGMFEATQIEIALEKLPVPRPMSHDLMKSILDAFDLKVKEIRIHDIIDGTFHAKIIVLKDSEGIREETRLIDARPSDAIALSLRTETPIFVARKIIEEAAIAGKPDDDEPDNEEIMKFREFLDNIKPADFKS